MGTLDFALPARLPDVRDRISTEFHHGVAGTLWVTMNKDDAAACHNFSRPLLHEMGRLTHALKDSRATWRHKGTAMPVHYVVLQSGHPDYFSLGGDLEHFHSCIEQQDRNGLYDYSKLCLDIMYEWATVLNGQATTVALVQGRALGGGFECALSADFLIAEERSEFGFPEILFGLFPCTGGMSLLARRVGVHEAERMMTNGRIYSAAELKDMGVVDEICPNGEGRLAVEKFVATHAKRRVARLMLQRSRHRVAPLDYQELLTVVEEWVETAMALGPDDLRVMEMLIRMQQGSRVAR